MPVIPVNRVVDTKRINGKKWRAEEEERQKGSLAQKVTTLPIPRRDSITRPKVPETSVAGGDDTTM
jgi:hypothetical protein